MEILLPQRSVEAIELTQILDALGLHTFALRLQLADLRRQKIARRQVDDDEGHHTDGQDRGNHDQQAVGDVAEQAASRPQIRGAG